VRVHDSDRKYASLAAAVHLRQSVAIHDGYRQRALPEKFAGGRRIRKHLADGGHCSIHVDTRDLVFPTPHRLGAGRRIGRIGHMGRMGRTPTPRHASALSSA